MEDKQVKMEWWRAVSSVTWPHPSVLPSIARAKQPQGCFRNPWAHQYLMMYTVRGGGKLAQLPLLADRLRNQVRHFPALQITSFWHKLQKDLDVRVNEIKTHTHTTTTWSLLINDTQITEGAGFSATWPGFKSWLYQLLVLEPEQVT